MALISCTIGNYFDEALKLLKSLQSCQLHVIIVDAVLLILYCVIYIARPFKNVIFLVTYDFDC